MTESVSFDAAVTERDAMARAIDLALGGWGRVHPNPLVGAVLLREGRIIAEGFHGEFGAPHAEIEALGSCTQPQGATCVVNLEPCAHAGKTPPCADALIRAGVTRVVYAVRDPDREAGGGGERLRQAGVDVVEGCGWQDAAALNASFLWSRVRPTRPFVALKLATSLDGFLADEREKSRWVSGPEARDFVHWLRAGYDAIAVGRRTAEIDDPRLTVRGSVEPRVPPRRVVFARNGALGRNLNVVRSAQEVPTAVLTARESEERLRSELAGTGVTVRGTSGLTQALALLREMQVRSLLVEGGGILATALLEAGLVDRFYWIQAPLWLGRGRAAFPQLPGSLLAEAARWAVTERRALGRDTLLVVDRKLCSPGL